MDHGTIRQQLRNQGYLTDRGVLAQASQALSMIEDVTGEEKAALTVFSARFENFVSLLAERRNLNADGEHYTEEVKLELDKKIDLASKLLVEIESTPALKSFLEKARMFSNAEIDKRRNESLDKYRAKMYGSQNILPKKYYGSTT